MPLSASIFITGGRRGLGLELCKIFCAHHYRVWTSGRDIQKVNQVLTAEGLSHVQCLSLDFTTTSFDETESLLASLPSLDGIIHNASLYNNYQLKTLSSTQALECTSFIKGNFALFKGAANKFEQQGKGRLFVMGSIVGELPYLSQLRPLYSFYKATLLPMTKIFNMSTPHAVSATLLQLGNIRDKPGKNKTSLTEKEVAKIIFRLFSQKKPPDSLTRLPAENDLYKTRAIDGI